MIRVFFCTKARTKNGSHIMRKCVENSIKIEFCLPN